MAFRGALAGGPGHETGKKDSEEKSPETEEGSFWHADVGKRASVISLCEHMALRRIPGSSA